MQYTNAANPGRPTASQRNAYVVTSVSAERNAPCSSRTVSAGFANTTNATAVGRMRNEPRRRPCENRRRYSARSFRVTCVANSGVNVVMIDTVNSPYGSWKNIHA